MGKSGIRKAIDSSKLKQKEIKMKKFDVHDKAVVLVLTKPEANALKVRLQQNTGFKKTKPLLKLEEKLAVEMGEV